MVMAMAGAIRDVNAIAQEGEDAMKLWDGIGMPPDGGNYAGRTDGHNNFWYFCLTCNKTADSSHCMSDNHKYKVRCYLMRTIGPQALASASAPAPPAAVPPAAAAPTTAALPKMAPPPLPLQAPLDPASSSSPPPQLPRIQDFFEEQEKRIKELAATADAMNTKLDAIMAAISRLSARPEPTGDRAAAAATSGTPGSAAAQQHDRGTWASSAPSTIASWSADAAAQRWPEWTQWGAAASTGTSAASPEWR